MLLPIYLAFEDPHEPPRIYRYHGLSVRVHGRHSWDPYVPIEVRIGNGKWRAIKDPGRMHVVPFETLHRPQVVFSHRHGWDYAVVVTDNDTRRLSENELVGLARRGSRVVFLGSAGPRDTFGIMGSFYLRGDRITVWTWLYSDHGLWVDSHYQFSTLRLSPKGFRLIRRRETRHTYPSFNDDYLPMPEEDPLREFGLRWRWWGKRIEPPTRRSVRRTNVGRRQR